MFQSDLPFYLNFHVLEISLYVLLNISVRNSQLGLSINLKCKVKDKT